MKALILLAMTFATVGNSQAIDTIYSEIGIVVSKKVNITVNQVSGDQLTQIKETMTYEKAVKRIENLQRDTANFSLYLTQLKQTENQIEIERKRIRMMRRDAIDLLEKLRNLLPKLQ